MQNEVTVEEVQSPEGEWMDVLEGSKATGLSPATLRRYVKKKVLKSRRLGRASNSKIQILITQELLQECQEDRVSTDGLDDVLMNEVEESPQEEISGETEEPDQAAYSGGDTLAWFRDKMDEADEQIQVKDQQINVLMQQLHAANYRNGYLEACKESYENQIKLLTDKGEQPQEELVAEEATEEPDSNEIMDDSKDEEESAENDLQVDETELLRQQLEELKVQMQDMSKQRKPWWKKWFMPVDPED